LKVHRGPYGFLLESVEQSEQWGRYSFLGTEPARVLRLRGRTVELETPGGATVRRETDDPFGEVKRLLAPYTPVAVPGLPRFTGGAVGYVGYDMAATSSGCRRTRPTTSRCPTRA
jgi:anthranilate synthase component 1